MQSMSEVGRTMTDDSPKPNWATGLPAKPRPEGPTKFEEQLRRFGLDEHTCAASRELRLWCERNKDRCYIPEWLLKEWRISVDANLSP